ncbi:MAG: LLM class flavin-dependent oxidoreductase [Solirubrobacterales bacterium]
MHISFVQNTFSAEEEDDGAVIKAIIEQSLKADELGFSAIMFPEKHFSGYMPNCADPLMTAAYLLPQIKQAVLGFCILAPNYFHPANVVEKINLLDHYAKGKLLIGHGSGFEIEAMLGFGIGFEDNMKSGFAEFTEVADRLWDKRLEDPPVEIDMKYHKGTIMERIVPRQYSEPRPRLAGVAVREQSIVRAAERGWPVFCPIIDDGFDAFRKRMQLYRQELAAAGHSPEVIADCLEWTALNVNAVTVCETDEEAEAQMREDWTSHLDLMDRLERRTRIRAREIDGVGGEFKPFATDREESLRTRCLYGSPETVASKIEAWAETGVGNVLMSFNVGAYSPERRVKQERSMDLFAAEVLPRVREIPVADLSVPTA